MKCRAMYAYAVVGLMGLAVCAMVQPAQADTVQVVVKYSGQLVKANTGTGPHEVFRGLVMPNGPVLTFLIDNTDEKKPTLAPDPKVEGPIKPLKAGDLITIILNPPKGNGPIPIESATVYQPKPGEDDPHAFVFVESFDQKKGNDTINLITLSKYLQKTIYKVPTHRDDTGDMVPDDALLGIASHVQPGELVYAVTIGSGNNATVKLLAPWKNHFTGKFVKFDADATVDSNNDTGPAVELTGPDGKAVTALIPGNMVGKRWVADPTIVGAARGLKADADVDYITADSGDKRTWLVSISRAKPAEKSASLSHGNNNE